MTRVFGDLRSGNCLKVKWLLDYLGRPYEWEHVDVVGGGARTEAFRQMNPAAQVPVVRLDDGGIIAQSNAIVLYFCEYSPLLPTAPYARAKMIEWLFWEQYSHEPYLAARRFQKVFLGKADDEIDPALFERGYAALRRMEAHLQDRQWLVGDLSAADLCLLPYTALAPQGGYDLSEFPAVRCWACRALEAFGADIDVDRA
jgi:glutathione S-transferase